MNTHFDIAIIGGGAVGATLACALARDRFRVIVVEASEPPSPEKNDEMDLRVFALSPASRHVFENLGVWEAMARVRVSPYGEMFVWDAGSEGAIRFDAADAGVACLGHIVENRVIAGCLWSRLRALPDVELACPDSLATFTAGDAGLEVELAGGARFTSDLVVGADGAWSRVRETAGIGSERHDYRQKGVVCVVGTEKAHRMTAWQRFLRSGPLAFLPLSDGRCSIVWSTDGARADELVAMPEEGFRRTLGEAFDHRLGAIISVGERAAFPLQRARARHYTADRVALIGDAAHVVHPLAGQGVNLGLLDAAVLAEELRRGRNAGRRPGSPVVLRRYERRRKGDNLLMAGAMHALHALFAANAPPVPQLRGLGLTLTDRLPPLKRLFMRHALGERPDAPALARPRDAA